MTKIPNLPLTQQMKTGKLPYYFGMEDTIMQILGQQLRWHINEDIK